MLSADANKAKKAISDGHPFARYTSANKRRTLWAQNVFSKCKSKEFCLPFVAPCFSQQAL